MKYLRLVLLAAVVPLCLVQGCDDASNEPLPNSGTTLCTNLYDTCIDLIFHNATNTGRTCSEGGCHNPPNGQGGFFLFPPVATPAELTSNFMQVQARTLNNNLLLSKASGNNHGGGSQLAVGDLCYTTISQWRSIQAPADGSPCTPAGPIVTNCAAIMGNPVGIVGACGP